MLLHLPIVIATTFSPIQVADNIPKFDIAKECRFESESTTVYQRCSQDEADALQKLGEEWPQFVRANRNSCIAEFDDWRFRQLCRALDLSRNGKGRRQGGRRFA